MKSAKDPSPPCGPRRKKPLFPWPTSAKEKMSSTCPFFFSSSQKRIASSFPRERSIKMVESASIISLGFYSNVLSEVSPTTQQWTDLSYHPCLSTYHRIHIPEPIL